MQICRRGHPLLLAAVCLQLLGLPLLSEGQSTLQLGRGALGEFGAAITLPEVEDQATRLMLGDAHGFLHVYEQRSEAEAFDEIWVSEYFEGPIAGVFIADINLDKLDEIILFTESGRFHFLDVRDYHTIWSNPPIRIGKTALHDLLDSWLPPGMPDYRRRQVAFSVVAQCVHYRMAGEVIAMLTPEEDRRRYHSLDQLAFHITTLTLASLQDRPIWELDTQLRELLEELAESTSS